ncbi:MAG: hypothetical protein HC905_05815 [Bacteroidales bacterium]|nr:hypothetical protein [Bacteroidales bacterium]
MPALMFAILVLISCQTGEKKPTRSGSGTAANGQEQSIQLKVNRFEMDLFSIPFDSVAKAVPGLEAKYGAFFDIFTNKIINIGSSKKPEFANYLKSFITDRYMFLTFQKVKEVYPDINTQADELENAFIRYHEIFPEKVIPHFYTLISGYNQSVVTADSVLAISLDKYLGPDCEYYDNLGLAMYQRRVMDKAYVSTDAMRGWCYSEFMFNDSAENVLTNNVVRR